MSPILMAICLHPHKHPDIPNLFLHFFLLRVLPFNVPYDGLTIFIVFLFLLEWKLHEGRALSCFVLRCIPSTWNSAWHRKVLHKYLLTDCLNLYRNSISLCDIEQLSSLLKASIALSANDMVGHEAH